MKNKNFKKAFKYSLITILIILLAYGITFYFSFFQGNTYVRNGQVISKIKPKNYKSIYTSSI